MHSRFQVEVHKQGRYVPLDVAVYQISDRRGERLEAQTQCHDPNHNRVIFQIRHATTFDEVFQKLQAMLIHRGYAPLRFRLLKEDPKTGYTRWLDWNSIKGGQEAIDDMIRRSVEQD